MQRVDQPQNLVSYHLQLLRDGGLVTALRSSFHQCTSVRYLVGDVQAAIDFHGNHLSFTLNTTARVCCCYPRAQIPEEVSA